MRVTRAPQATSLGLGASTAACLLAALCACTKASTPPPPSGLTARAFPLPGANGPVTVDYIASDRGHARVWVPVGETGSVDVLDAAKGTFTSVAGFATAEREGRGRMRRMGPSAVTLGDGFAYVGNRATSEVCAVDEKTLTLGDCSKLPTPTDGVAYVASSKEVWVTTPRDKSVTVLDATKPETLEPKLVIKTDGAPEGYAIDSVRGLFYTNLEDANRTLAVDVKTHAVAARWSPGCGSDGPRGLAVDEARDLVMVACTDGVRVLDGAHGGALLGTLDAGAGVDNIEYLDKARVLVVAAGKASRLTVARLSDQGALSVVATAATADGARNAVVDADGNVYVVDPRGARLLSFGFAMTP